MAKSKSSKSEVEEKEKANFVVRSSFLAKIKYIALKESQGKERKKVYQADIIDEALNDYINKFEKKNGEIKL